MVGHDGRYGDRAPRPCALFAYRSFPPSPICIDYVIIHELAHLEVHGHNDDFWRLVYRYPKAERSIGYLIAKSGDGDEVD